MSVKGLKKKAVFLLVFTVLMSSLSMISTIGASAADTSTYEGRFLDMYAAIKNPANGYFSNDKGIPYHSIETMMVEAPDYGHVTTSEAMSYYVWLEAVNGKITGDFSGVVKAWDTLDKSLIPSSSQQPGFGKSNPSASYADEYQDPSGYPCAFQLTNTGTCPIHKELSSAYNNGPVYMMHWMGDVDNWYGYGTGTDFTFINTFQRGEQESTWETVPHPSIEMFKYGNPTSGYLALFGKGTDYAKQWRYTSAPDADARAVQAAYQASKWAKDWNKSSSVQSVVERAAKMGDYLRSSFFDKYYKKIGCQDKNSPTAGYDSAHYTLGWYVSWGGDINGQWSFKIGSSATHFFYQNPMAAWALVNDSGLKSGMKSPNAVRDWTKSLQRQLEMYQWLQSAEGPIAGGCTNSYNGRYEKYPAGTSTFYDMAYDPHPVYKDPPSNNWMGNQTWSLQRMAEFYYETGNEVAKSILDKWVTWVKKEIKLNNDGTFAIPSNIDWTGQPDTWTGSPSSNAGLHAKVKDYGTDIGVTGSLCNLLTYYAKKSGDKEALNLAKGLLDRLWNYRDSKGISIPEKRADYKRFFDQEVYIPQGWTGTMPNGDQIKSGIKFIDIRTKYKQDPDWNKLYTAYQNNESPEFSYHRFWHECDVTIALGIMSTLFPGEKPGTNNPQVSPTPTVVNPSPTPTITGNFDYDFQVKTTFSSSKLVANQMFTAKVEAANVSQTAYSGNKDVLLIVALYDSNNTMQNVSYISKGIPYRGTETLSAGFKLPSNVNGYSVRAFMWDGTDMKDTMMIPLSNVTQLP